MKTITIELSGYDIKTIVTSSDASMSESDFARTILAKIREAVADLNALHTIVIPGENVSLAARTYAANKTAAKAEGEVT